MRDFAKAFYYSTAWKRCRKAYIAHRNSIDGGMCEECHEHPGYIIHHRIELTPENINDPNITLDMSNLMYVCHDCHNRIHGNVTELPERAIRYTFGPDGNPIVI